MSIKSMKEKFAKLFIRKDNETEPELGTKESRTWRTRRYRRFFEGYTEVLEPKPGGGSRTKMVYTGDYYRADMSRTNWRLMKILYWLIFALSFAVWAIFAFKRSAANTVWYVYIPEVVSLCAYLFLLRYLIERAFAPHKLIIREYKEAVKHVRMSAAVLMGALALSALTVVLHLIFTAAEIAELIEAAAFAASGGCVYAIYRLEKGIVYERIPNEDSDADGYSIT